jgi:hypothetical protein
MRATDCPRERINRLPFPPAGLTDGMLEALEDLGFTPTDAGDFERDGMIFTIEKNDWFTLHTPCGAAPADPLRGQAGRPGLWKLVAGGAGREPASRRDARSRRWAWEVPLSLVRDEEGAPEEGAAFRDVLLWGLSTSRGEIPSGWSAPSRVEVDQLIPAGALTVRVGSLVRQGSCVCLPDRLAMAFPIVWRIPPDLPARRRRCLHSLLVDAQDQWRLVRFFCVEKPEGVEAVAEVDMTGLPSALVERGVSISLAALRWVLPWLIKPADLLVNLAVRSKVLDGLPRAGGPRGKEQ